MAQTSPSWWQTGPIFSQLGEADKGPLDPYHSKGIQITPSAVVKSWADTGAIHSGSDSGEALATEISGITVKGTVVPAHRSLVHLVNPLFVSKSGGGWHPIIDLRHLNQ